jgi:hypothetical protein
MRNVLKTYIEEYDLIDIWRKQHNDEAQFTYHCKTRNEYIFTRLDYFLVSFGISNLIQTSSINSSILTDHSLIKIKLELVNNKRGPGFWKFNCSLLHDTDYVSKIKLSITETVQIEQEQNPGLLWEAIKLRIRTDTIQYSSRKKRSKKNTLTALEKRLGRLERQFQFYPNEEDSRDIKLVKDDIENIIKEEVDGCIIRSKLNWQEYGEKPTKFFLSLEKRNFNNKTIKRLRLSNGNIVTDQTIILQELHSFYSKLYTTGYKNVPDFSGLDDLNIPTLTADEQIICEGYLKENEILEALKTCKNNKSPGTDGLPAEFYKYFWNDLKHYLLEALNYGYDRNEFSVTQRDGLITLIPKKNKDTIMIKNYRPLTLLNQDYKLATKAIAKRLCKVLPKLIDPDQTGFLKDRYIGENIFKITNLMNYVDENNIPALLLSADFEKAFDSLEWKFIDYSLKRFNFGPYIIKWVEVFYTNIKTRVSNNGWVTDIFNPTRGSRQGCPLSAYLFLMCAEILACLFRNDNNIERICVDHQKFLISQYADDTILILKYSEENLKEAIKIFDLYAMYSGLKLNYEKSDIMPLGPIKHRFNILLPESRFNWTEGPITSLGVKLCHRTEDLIKLNYSQAIEKINNSVKIWNKRHLTLYGKVVIINTYIISQLVYLMSVLPKPSKEMINHINKTIFNFLWNNKPDKIKRDIMKLPKYLGGLSVPDVAIKNIALKIAWVPRAMKNSCDIWFYKNMTIPINLLWQCNMNEQDTNNITINLQNQFVKEIIESWFK